MPFPGENFVAVAMKHINEPPPDLLEQRPDVPLRLAAAVERALEKDPARPVPVDGRSSRAELRQCLAELDAPDAERTFIAPSPVLRESRAASRARDAQPRCRSYALVALVAVAAIVAGVLALGGSKGKPHARRRRATGAAGRAAAASAHTTRSGNDGEHDADAPKRHGRQPVDVLVHRALRRRRLRQA